MIIFLQNAWSPAYAGTAWPRRSWLRALAASRSGGKLRMLTDDLSVVHNVAPICAASSSGVTPTDERHVRTILDSCAPAVVVACGRHAEAALVKLWPGPLLCLPHPAHRVVTNALYQRAARMLKHGHVGRVALRQARGAVKAQPLA